MKSRYYYYLVFLNLIANVIIFVPRILINHRYDGAVISIIIAIPIGLLAGYFFTKAMNKYPGKGLPEIMEDSFLPSWFSKLVILMITIVWFISGVITILTFSNIVHRFMNPDMNEIYVTFLFIVFLYWATNSSAASILYLLEIVLVLNGPLIVYLFIKAFLNDAISWPDMKAAVTNIWHMPSWATLGAATYMLSGYTNLVIFHRQFNEKINLRPYGILIILSTLGMLTSYFIPIGFYGIDGVGQLTFPWLSSADALRIEFGFVERVFFIFLLIYIGISLVNVIVHWHVGVELLISILPREKEKIIKKNQSIKNTVKQSLSYKNVILFLFSLVTLILNRFLDEPEVFDMVKWWMKIRMPIEYFGLFLLLIITRRKKNE